MARQRATLHSSIRSERYKWQSAGDAIMTANACVQMVRDHRARVLGVEKRLKPGLPSREVEMLRRVDAVEGTPRVIDVQDDEGRAFVMTHTRGTTLADLMQQKVSFHPNFFAGVAAQLALILKRVGDEGVVHRDVKLRNVLLDTERQTLGPGIIGLVDFGDAMLVGERPIGESDKLRGTPLVMPPEVVEDRPLDPSTDVYAFGVAGYMMLHDGRSPALHTSSYDLNKLRKQFDGGIHKQHGWAKTTLAKVFADCVRSNPVKRPKFDEVADRLHEISLQGPRDLEPQDLGVVVGVAHVDERLFTEAPTGVISLS